MITRSHFHLCGLAGLSILIASCSTSATRPATDEDKLITAALALQAGRDREVCVDSAAKGRPLAVFVTMMNHRPVGLAAPAWYEPAPLVEAAATTASKGPGERRDAGKMIGSLANRTGVLPADAQAALNGAATVLARQATSNRVEIFNSPAWPRIHARWWVLNRLSRSCRPVFALSTPVVSKGVGFISVKTDRTGTTYAFSRQGDNWIPRAQWTNWLY